MLGVALRALVVLAALAVLFLTPVWAETAAGYGVVPVWWPEPRAGSRSLLVPGLLVDAVALIAAAAAVVWPRLRRR